MNLIADSILKQNEMWIENAKQDLWKAEYNLKVGHQRNNEIEIAKYQTQIIYITKMIGKFEAQSRYINRNI